MKEIRPLEIGGDVAAKEEAKVLTAWAELNRTESKLSGEIKELEAALDETARVKYPKLSEAEIKTLVVEDKWLAAMAADIHGEMDRISQALTARVKELAERYETPLPAAAHDVERLEQAVNAHLQRMGFSWN